MPIPFQEYREPVYRDVQQRPEESPLSNSSSENNPYNSISLYKKQEYPNICSAPGVSIL